MRHGIAVVAEDWLVQHSLARIIENEIGDNVVSVHNCPSSIDPDKTILAVWLPCDDNENFTLSGMTILGLGDACGTSLISWLPNWRSDETATATTVAALYADCVASKQSHSVLPTHDSTMPHLTRRQACVLRALAYGMSNAEIAVELHMAENTVRIHISAIFRALKVSNRTQAALQANRLGIVALTDSLQ